MYFETDGGEEVQEVEVPHRNPIFTKNDIEKAGYIFGGWYTSDSYVKTFDVGTVITENTVLHAKWIAIDYEISYLIDSDIQNNNPDSFNIEDENIVLQDPIRPGYTFKGWYDNEALEGEAITIIYTDCLCDIELYADWEINEYTLSFVNQQESSLINFTYAYDAEITIDFVLERDYHTFGGWYKDTDFVDVFDYTHMPAYNLTLYAKWVPNNYTISFDSEGGSIIDSITQAYDTEVAQPSNPVKLGHTFEGWFTDDQHTLEYTFDKMDGEDILLYAKWSIGQYTIDFQSNGGSNVADIVQYYDTSVIEPAIPTFTGHTFDKWYADSSCTVEYIFDKMPAQDTTLFAKWITNNYTLTFDSVGGSEISPITAPYNALISPPENPTRIGYIFNGWYEDIESTKPYSFNRMGDANITLYVGWVISNNTVGFNSNGGTIVNAITQDYGTALNSPLSSHQTWIQFYGLV